MTQRYRDNFVITITKRIMKNEEIINMNCGVAFGDIYPKSRRNQLSAAFFIFYGGFIVFFSRT